MQTDIDEAASGCTGAARCERPRQQAPPMQKWMQECVQPVPCVSTQAMQLINYHCYSYTAHCTHCTRSGRAARASCAPRYSSCLRTTATCQPTCSQLPAESSRHGRLAGSHTTRGASLTQWASRGRRSPRAARGRRGSWHRRLTAPTPEHVVRTDCSGAAQRGRGSRQGMQRAIEDAKQHYRERHTYRERPPAAWLAAGRPTAT